MTVYVTNSLNFLFLNMHELSMTQEKAKLREDEDRKCHKINFKKLFIYGLIYIYPMYLGGVEESCEF